MHGDVLGLGDEAAFGVEYGRRGVLALLDVRGISRANERRAHLLGHREQGVRGRPRARPDRAPRKRAASWVCGARPRFSNSLSWRPAGMKFSLLHLGGFRGRKGASLIRQNRFLFFVQGEAFRERAFTAGKFWEANAPNSRNARVFRYNFRGKPHAHSASWAQRQDGADMSIRGFR